MAENFTRLLRKVRACRACEGKTPAPRPILSAHREARVLIVGQAPGRKAHETGIPWNDASGERLRGWLGVNREAFYDSRCFAIIPMGFCYPGTGPSGDLPPRRECVQLWLPRLLAALPNIELKILIGQYAQAYYFGNRRKATLTATVRAWREYWPDYLPLPHSSPRNTAWFKYNPWLDKEVSPALRAINKARH